jgi:hypothetical protein
VVKDGVEPGTPAKLTGESRGGATITLTMRIPDRPHPGPSLTPRASPIVILSLEDLPGKCWPQRRRRALDRLRDARKRKRESTVK